MLKRAVTASALALSLCGAAFAQEQGQGQRQSSIAGMGGMVVGASTAERMFIPVQSVDQVMVSSLIGASVVDAGGSEMGTVQDMILGEQGRLVGYVISFGGMLGIGEKRVGVPFARAEIASTEKGDAKVLRLKSSRDEFDSAPEFKESDGLDAGGGVAGGGSGSRM